MTIGNVIGGSVLVGAVYWFVYLRRTRCAPGEAMIPTTLAADDGPLASAGREGGAR